jgi:hypothetical protein
MKRHLSALLLAITAAVAAPPVQIPADASALQQKLVRQLSPAIREWVRRQADQMRARSATGEAVVRGAVTERFRDQSPSATDVDALVFLVVFEVAEDADKEAREELKQMEEERHRQQRVRDQAAGIPKGGLRPREDTISTMDQMSNLRLQMAVDRRSQAITTLSNLLKKFADSQQTITQNLK